MLDRECTLYAMVLRYCKLLADDIPDDQMAAQPAPGMNHAAWILGHLAVCTDYAARFLGERPLACPKDWHRLCGPGSQLQTDRAAYPAKAELLAALERGHARVAELARKATAEQLAAAQPGPFLQRELPTVGDIVAHLMTTHPCIHLGQLSAWRRARGMASVLKI